MDFEIIEVYPVLEKEMQKLIEIYKKNKNKAKSKGLLKEAGTIHIYFKDFDIDIKNIKYRIYKTGGVHDYIEILFPGNVYKVEGENMFVPTISWRDKEIWLTIKNAIIKEIRGLTKGDKR